MPREWDLIVVGGGPGGAAAAAVAAVAGLETLLLERGGTLRHKPCGGILPEITEELNEDVFGATLPPEVLAEQWELRLRYTPPSGEANGGRVRESRLLNVKRDHFDQWLRDRAALAGAIVRQNARVSNVEADGGFSVSYSQRGEERRATAARLVGADGVHSLVRRRLAPDAVAPKMLVGQRLVQVAGELPADFHCVFAGMLSPFYAYSVPKGGLLKIGSGMIEEERTDLMPSLDRFSKWLEQNGVADIGKVVQQEGWAIPFGEQQLDAAGALLVGDAAGLCNPLSGEGIRLAIESGQLAAESIIEAGVRSPVPDYRDGVAGIAQMVAALHRVVLTTDDDAREQFVAAELARP